MTSPEPGLAPRRRQPGSIGFLMTVVGAALVGVGATQTWITIGLEGTGGDVDSAIPGVDVIDGKVALACALLLLLGALGSRMARSSGGRTTMAAVAIGAGIVAFAIGGAFLVMGRSRSFVVDQVGIPEAEFERFGVTRELGIGPVLVLAGGLMGFVGAILSLAGAVRIRTEKESPDVMGASSG